MSNENRRPWYIRPQIAIPGITGIIAVVAIIVNILTTLPPPDFSISVNPVQGIVQQGGVISTAITVKGEQKYKESISLSASGLPSGVVVTFVPPIGGPAPTFTSNVIITVGSDTSIGRYEITIKGIGSDGKEHSSKYTLNVMPITTHGTPPTPSVKINVEYEGGTQFTGRITGRGLKPDSEYMLTLNGKGGQAGNEALKQFGESDGEGVYDFMQIRTNSKGDISADFTAEDLPSGKYDVTFLMKETGDNWKSVYIRDHVRFTITPPFTPIYVTDAFYPSGWMGDWRDITFDDGWTENPHSKPTSIKITYSAARSQGEGWAGIYWQYPDKNWGDNPDGRDLTGATKLTFWARGEKGGEKAEFKVGGITGAYPDSIKTPVSTDVVVLSDKWQQYTIDLTGKDLSHVIGGFDWATSKDQNPYGSTIYLDDIRYE